MVKIIDHNLGDTYIEKHPYLPMGNVLDLSRFCRADAGKQRVLGTVGHGWASPTGEERAP